MTPVLWWQVLIIPEQRVNERVLVVLIAVDSVTGELRRYNRLGSQLGKLPGV